MKLFSKSKVLSKNQASKWQIKNKSYSSSNKKNKEIIIRKDRDYSELRQSFKNTVVRNISIDFKFPNTKTTYNYKRSFLNEEFPMFEQRNTFYYDNNFQLFKNKSVSKFTKSNNKFNISSKQNKFNSPQHNIITSIKRIKNIDDSRKSQEPINKNDKKRKSKSIEKDIYQLEIINQIIFNGTYADNNNYKKTGGKSFIKDEKEINDPELKEIEQRIFKNEKDKKNNLLNTVNVEIEKENGDKQLIIVEISNNEKNEDKFAEIRSLEQHDLLLPEFNKNEKLYSTFENDFLEDSLSMNSYEKTTITNASSGNMFTSISLKNYDSLNLRIEKDNETFLNEIDSKKRLFTSNNIKKNNLEKSMNIKPLNHKMTKENGITPIEKEIFNKKKIRNKLLGVTANNPINNYNNKSIEMKEEYFIKNNNPNKKEDKNNNFSEKKNEKIKLYNFSNEKKLLTNIKIMKVHMYLLQRNIILPVGIQ